jgi:hypothetical protein
MRPIAGLQTSGTNYSVMHCHIPGEWRPKIKLSLPSVVSVIMAAQSQCRCFNTEKFCSGHISL